MSLRVVFLLGLLVYGTYNLSLCSESTISPCLPCPVGCSTCSAATVCTTCIEGYFFNGSQCLSCRPYCLDCFLGVNTCSRCQGAYLLTSNQTCAKCMIDNAATCLTQVTALTCLDGFQISDGYCLPCLLNCRKCSSIRDCSQCMEGFYLNTSVSTCNPCQKGCDLCQQTDPTICLRCQNGYSFSSGRCSLVACSIAGCMYCLSTQVCARCKAGLYWDGSVCQSGASLLCFGGAIGNLPTQCQATCVDTAKSIAPNSNSMTCIPYSSTASGSARTTQIYLYAYNNQALFQQLSHQSTTSVTSLSNGQYAFTVNSLLQWANLDAYFRVFIGLKYQINSAATMTLTATASNDQSENIAIPAQPTPKAIILQSSVVHASNLKLTFSSPITILQLLLTIQLCPNNCQQCLNNDLCQICLAPQYMLNYGCVTSCDTYYTFQPNRTCLSACPVGYYHQVVSATVRRCTLCTAPCSSCLSPTICLSCVTGKYLYLDTCLSTCPAGYFGDSGLCQPCVSPCSTCSSKSVCLSCEAGYWNGLVCTALCSNGQFGNDKTNRCEACDNNCLTCSTTSTTCTSCRAGQFLNNKQCLSSCPARYYPGQQSCIPCQPPCYTCSSASNCLSCTYNFLSGTNCVQSCPSAQFANPLTLKCEACPAVCGTCLSQTYCLTCLTGCWENGGCPAKCNAFSFPKTVNSQCVCSSCVSPCKTCVSELVCTSCLTGYYFQSSCLQDCPITYFRDDSAKTCRLCSSIFLNCNMCNSLACQSCLQGYFLFQSSCTNTCPSLYFRNGNACFRCYSPCHQCSAIDTCINCVQPFYFYSGVCTIQCPVGYLPVNGATQNSCTACTAPCASCDTTVTNCLSCVTSTYLFNNNCYSDCSTATSVTNSLYNDPSLGICVACESPCLLCSSKTACISCRIGYLDTTTRTCVDCSPGYYPKNKVCTKCPTECILCISDVFCTLCKPSFLMFQQRCVANASICEAAGYYAATSICLPCSSPCKTCSGAGTSCVTCLNGFFFVGPNLCLSQCPASFFNDRSTCAACNSRCKTCSGSSTYCYSCKQPYLTNLALMQCVDSCPSGTYASVSSCKACKYPCLTCQDEVKCLSCVVGTLTNFQCYSSCSMGTYSDAKQVCQACSSDCADCSVSPTNCTLCPTSKYLLASTCTPNCPNGYFADRQLGKCIACPSRCFLCSNYLNCLGCTSGLILFNNPNTGNGECITNCPGGFYQNIPVNNGPRTCTACLANCLRCASPSSCSMCVAGMNLLDGACVSSCPNGKYAQQATCLACISPCLTCTDAYTCLSCISGDYLLVGNAQCILSSFCPTGFYKINGQKKCNSKCPDGEYHQANRTCSAKGCDTNLFMGADMFCYSQCPTGYAAELNRKCLPCNSCTNYLSFTVKYYILKDDLYFSIAFSQAPLYAVKALNFNIDPPIPYALTVSSDLTLADAPYQGPSQIVLHLQPTQSLQTIVYTVSVQRPVQSILNPLQVPSASVEIKGFDRYDTTTSLASASSLIILCSVIGLFRNPFMTDFGQLPFLMSLIALHYPSNLEDFLVQTRLSNLNQLLPLESAEWGTGKLSYITTPSLLANSGLSILLVLLFGFIGGLVHLSAYLHRARLGYSKVTDINAQQQPQLNHWLFALSDHWSGAVFNRVYCFCFNGLFYFSLTQLIDGNSKNKGSVLGLILSGLCIVSFPFWVWFMWRREKPRYSFLIVRKALICSSVVLSVQYAAYSIGIISVCHITAMVLIATYKQEKLRAQTKFRVAMEGLQLVWQVGFALFVLLGQGNYTSFKGYLALFMIFWCLIIALLYLACSLLDLVLWLIVHCGGRDYRAEWQQNEEPESADTDSETSSNNSLRIRRTTRNIIPTEKIEPLDLQPKHSKQPNNTKEAPIQNEDIRDQLDENSNAAIMPLRKPKLKEPDQQMFWTYNDSDQSSQQQGDDKSDRPPELLIRCVNEFSDFDPKEKRNL